MPRLVQHAEERGEKIAGVVAGGQAGVARTRPGAKRMRGGVDASRLKIEADGARNLLVEGHLGGDRKITFQHRRGFRFLKRGFQHRD